jgi:hypothetical protein
MHPESPRDLLRVDLKEEHLCREFGFSMAHLTAYSVHWLTIWDIPSTYENISVLNARLFPSKFALAGFPELPDAMCTNREILHLRPKYRGFATSDPRRGVFLTDKGREAAVKVLEALGPPTFDGKALPAEATVNNLRRPAKGRARTYNPALDLEERRSRLLFRWFKEGCLNEADVVHLLGLLGLYDHTPPVEVRREFKRLRDIASDLHDEEFLSFLDAVQKKFRAYLERQDTSHGKEQKP